MKLSDIFSYLTYGELQNLKCGGKDEGGIFPKYSDEVTSYIQRGLTDLHTKFILKSSELIVQQYEHITMYNLKPEFALSNDASSEEYKYIIDSPENPFLDNVIRIEEVYNEEGIEVFTNRENEPLGCTVFTPQYNVLQVPTPIAENSLSLIYRGDHAKLKPSSTNKPEVISIDIPPPLVEALILYVSSLAHTSVGSPEGVQQGMLKMREYEAKCIELVVSGAVQKEDWTNHRIWRNGWV